MANQRLQREVKRRLGNTWTHQHDRVAARLLFKSGGISSEDLQTILERPLPKAEQGFRLW
jgi:hypothetical protein